MKTIILACAMLVLLAGCAQQFAQADDETCRSYGIVYGTEAYAQCRQNLATQRDARFAGASAAMSRMGAIYSAPTYQAPARPLTTNCQRWYNGEVHCTTF